MSKIAETKALEAYPYPTVMDLVTDEEECGKLVDKAKLCQSVYIKGYDQATQDFLEKAIIAYCEVCKMPNCMTQNKKTCPYLSKFRRLLNN